MRTRAYDIGSGVSDCIERGFCPLYLTLPSLAADELQNVQPGVDSGNLPDSL